MSWARTLLGLQRCKVLFDSVSIGEHDADWLLRINLGLAALLLAGAFSEPRLDQFFLHAQGSLASLLGAMLVLTPAAYALLRILTAIERAGLRFFSNRRGGRVTPGIARAVTAHASYGWVLSGALASVGAFLGHIALQPWYNQIRLGWLFAPRDSHIVFALLGFGGGLLVFEILSYLGTLRCRFANAQTEPEDATRSNATGSGIEPTVDDHA